MKRQPVAVFKFLLYLILTQLSLAIVSPETTRLKYSTNLLVMPILDGYYYSFDSYRKVKKYLLILIVALASSNILMAQNKELDAIRNLQEFVNAAKKEDWKQAKQKNGITIITRKLELFDTINVRELMVKFMVSGSIDSILSMIKHPDKLKTWNYGIKKAKILKEMDTNWILHTVYKIPFPFSQQDLVASYSIGKRKDVIVISSKSTPDFIKPIKGITREGYNLSQWLLIPRNNGRFEIKFSAISITNSKIPRWIKDPLIQRMLLKSFGEFKNGFP